MSSCCGTFKLHFARKLTMKNSVIPVKLRWENMIWTTFSPYCNLITIITDHAVVCQYLMRCPALNSSRNHHRCQNFSQTQCLLSCHYFPLLIVKCLYLALPFHRLSCYPCILLRPCFHDPSVCTSQNSFQLGGGIWVQRCTQEMSKYPLI